QVREAAPQRRARGARPEAATGDREPATVEPVDPEQRAGDLGPSRARETGEPDDLATADFERDVGEETAAPESASLEDDLADLRFLLREERLERAPHHQPDHLRMRQLPGRARGDVLAVT